MVLYIPFEGDLRETPREASISEPFVPYQPTVHEIVYAIDRAASDDRVKGIMARLDDGNVSLSHAQEIRSALKRFKETGKFTTIYSSSYGGTGGGLSRYYLASAFDEIWMQPLGIVTIPGVRAEVPFFRALLDKIGVTPQFFQREDHKTVYESLTRRSMSPENRETLEGVVGAIRDEIVTTIPQERGIAPEAFSGLVNQGLFTAQEALDNKLITTMDYADVLVENLREEITGDRESEEQIFVGVGSYLGGITREQAKGMMSGLIDQKPSVALIYAVGPIMDNAAGASPGGVAAADTIAEAIVTASDDDSIETIVLRVDSPGGSPIASERILRALHNAKNKDGKHVIVSMGATAASGGYWIATNADRIFALPVTLTGSIGVVGGKFAIGELSKNLDVNWDNSVRWGQNSGMWSLTTPFSESEAERMNAMLDQIYDAFLTRVAEGRNMSLEQARDLAGGRVWTGRAALEVGLVDEMGGLEEALDYAATLSGKTDSHELNVVVLPQPKNTLEQILELLGAQAFMAQSIQANRHFIDALEPVLQDMAVYSGNRGVNTYDPVRID